MRGLDSSPNPFLKFLIAPETFSFGVLLESANLDRGSSGDLIFNKNLAGTVVNLPISFILFPRVLPFAFAVIASVPPPPPPQVAPKLKKGWRR